MIQGAWDWCTGMTQRDGMGREVGGVKDGEHMSTHGGFMSVYGKTIQCCKVISVQLNKFILKKLKSESAKVKKKFKKQ